MYNLYLTKILCVCVCVTLLLVRSYVEPNIFIQGTRLDMVDSFIYLGSTLSRDEYLDSE